MERGVAIRMKPINAVILSGTCCNPQLASLDEKIQTRLRELADKNKLEVNISIVSILSAATGGLGLGKETGEAIQNLIASKGMSVLPLVVFNDTIAFYGGLASAQMIEEKLNIAAQS